MITARNLHRGYVLQGHAMGVGIESEAVDFKEMPMGSVQAFWSGEDAIDGTLELEASDDGEHWDTIRGSKRTLDHPRRTWLWDLGKIGYRYVRVVYVPVSVTTGLLTAFAIGKGSR